MIDNRDKILSNILAMNPEQLTTFIASLSLDQLNHLDVLLEKAEKDSFRLKVYLDLQ